MRIATSCVILSCDPLAIRDWSVLRSISTPDGTGVVFSIDTKRKMCVHFPRVIGCQVPVVKTLRL